MKTLLLIISLLFISEPRKIPPEFSKLSKESCEYEVSKALKTLSIYKDGYLVITQDRSIRRIKGTLLMPVKDVAELHCDAYLSLDRLQFKLYLRAIDLRYTVDELEKIETTLYPE